MSRDVRSQAGYNNDRKCVYKRGGVCNDHGAGARRVFKPSWETSTSLGGTKTTVYKKRWGWRCDLISKKTKDKLKQSNISMFLKPATKITAGMGDIGRFGRRHTGITCRKDD